MRLNSLQLVNFRNYNNLYLLFRYDNQIKKDKKAKRRSMYGIWKSRKA